MECPAWGVSHLHYQSEPDLTSSWSNLMCPLCPQITCMSSLSIEQTCSFIPTSAVQSMSPSQEPLWWATTLAEGQSMRATLSLLQTANIPSLHSHTKDNKGKMLIVRPSNSYNLLRWLPCLQGRWASDGFISHRRETHPLRLKQCPRLTGQKCWAPVMWIHY